MKNPPTALQLQYATIQTERDRVVGENTQLRKDAETHESLVAQHCDKMVKLEQRLRTLEAKSAEPAVRPSAVRDPAQLQRIQALEAELTQKKKDVEAATAEKQAA